MVSGLCEKELSRGIELCGDFGATGHPPSSMTRLSGSKLFEEFLTKY